jgi:hypothetical protein
LLEATPILGKQWLIQRPVRKTIVKESQDRGIRLDKDGERLLF